MSQLILALVLASAAWLIRGAFLDREEAEVERLLEELEVPAPIESEEASGPAQPEPEEASAPARSEVSTASRLTG